MLDMSNTGPSALHAVGDCTPSATVTCYWRGLQRKLGNDSRARVCWICRIQGLRPCTPSATARRRRQLLATGAAFSGNSAMTRARAYVGYVEYRAFGLARRRRLHAVGDSYLLLARPSAETRQ